MRKENKTQREEHELIKKNYLENPTDVQAIEKYAESCYKMKKLKDAERVYAELISSHPETSKYYYRIGKVFFDLARYEDALAQQELAVQKFNGLLWAHLEKIKCLIQLGRYHEIVGLINELEKKIIDKKKEVLLLKNLLKVKVEFLVINKAFSDAIIVCGELIEIDSNDGYSYYDAGKINLELQKYDDALQNFLKADSILNQAYIKDKIATTLAFLERKQEAIQVYQKIPSHKMEDYIYQHFGRLFFSMEDFDNAKLQLKCAIIKGGKSLYKSHFHLGLVYEKLQLYRNAIQEYTLANEIRKKEYNKDYVEALERINYLKSNVTVNSNEILESYQINDNEPTEIHKGRIEKYFDDRGFGFIREGAINNIFFHVKNCKIKNPKEGDEVKYLLTDGKKGKEAIQVELVKK